MTIYAVIDEVLRELDRAVDTYPQWPTDPVHAAAVVAEESGELVQAVLQCTYQPGKSDIHHVRIEAVQTAAMALRFLARMDGYRFAPCEQVPDPRGLKETLERLP